MVPAHLAPRVRTAALVAVTLAFGAGLSLRAPAAPAADPCALPGGIALEPLSAVDRSWLAHRAIACSDLTHGRIDRAAYRTAVTVAAPPPAPPAVEWAASVLGVSSQWSADQWSAARALGPPEVYPASGDDARAWASAGADDRVEWIEVALAAPRRIAAVQIVETFNPGAVHRLDLTTASGRVLPVFVGAAHATGEPARVTRFDVPCTDEPIVAIRVQLDSSAVAGWNELDAIGAIPCD